MLRRVINGEMPPEKQGRSQQLPEPEINLLKRWLAGGAVWPKGRALDFFEATNEVRAGRDWWALQPIVRPAIPKLKSHPQPQNPIDAFILANLEAKGVQPAPRASRRAR